MRNLGHYSSQSCLDPIPPNLVSESTSFLYVSGGTSDYTTPQTGTDQGIAMLIECSKGNFAKGFFALSSQALSSSESRSMVLEAPEQSITSTGRKTGAFLFHSLIILLSFFLEPSRALCLARLHGLPAELTRGDGYTYQSTTEGLRGCMQLPHPGHSSVQALTCKCPLRCSKTLRWNQP